MSGDPSLRAFKTAWFVRAAKRARIGDGELARAVAEAASGLAVDLGGGVYKKRLGQNRHRSIVLAWSGSHWVFAYLFAKQDRANIDAGELEGFRKLARAYRAMDQDQLAALIEAGDLVEITFDDR